jgi:hypothetical protein
MDFVNSLPNSLKVVLIVGILFFNFWKYIYVFLMDISKKAIVAFITTSLFWYGFISIGIETVERFKPFGFWWIVLFYVLIFSTVIKVQAYMIHIEDLAIRDLTVEQMEWYRKEVALSQVIGRATAIIVFILLIIFPTLNVFRVWQH